jgi:beta-glucosidase
VKYDDGTNIGRAEKAAANAQVSIVFVQQWMTEGQDAATLSLPDGQDALVEAVAKANPNTIVVLETGGPVTMPWAPAVKGIVEAWYPGIGGGQAIANILFGKVNPSGKLPVTFAARDSDLPHPHVTGLTDKTANNGMNGADDGKRTQLENFEVDYNLEGMMTGYRWFQAKDKQPLFAFGFGLSYTRFAYSDLKVGPQAKSVSFELRNTGSLAGDEVCEVYITLPSAAGEPFRKLAGWKRVTLAAGASETVEIPLDPLYLSIFSTGDNRWKRVAGEYLIEAGGSSAELPLRQAVQLTGR